MSNTYIWPIDRTLTGATTLGQRGPGNDGNEGVLCIPQSSSITAEIQSVYSTAPANWTIQDTCWGSINPLQRCNRCILLPQPEHLLVEYYPSAEMHSVYSTAPARTLFGGVLPLCRDTLSVFYCHSQFIRCGLVSYPEQPFRGVLLLCWECCW